MKFILKNHNIQQLTNLDLFNRSFFYGDGFFETILYCNGKFPLLKFHFERIKKSCQILNFEFTQRFTFEGFENELQQLIIANKIENIDSVVKINFFRNGESGYAPVLNLFSYYAQVKNWQPKNANLKLCFYEDEKKATGKLASLKSASALIYVMAAQFSKNKNVDEVSHLLKGTPNTGFKITVKRPGTNEEITKEIKREEVVIKSVSYSGMIDQQIAYIKFTQFTDNSARELSDAFKELKKNNLRDFEKNTK